MAATTPTMGFLTEPQRISLAVAFHRVMWITALTNADFAFEDGHFRDGVYWTLEGVSEQASMIGWASK